MKGNMFVRAFFKVADNFQINEKPHNKNNIN